MVRNTSEEIAWRRETKEVADLANVSSTTLAKWRKAYAIPQPLFNLWTVIKDQRDIIRSLDKQLKEKTFECNRLKHSLASLQALQKGAYDDSPEP